MSKGFCSGFVSIIGRPNVGKSTLMNHFIGEKIAITSNKPQTTRNKIQSILTRDEFQMVFIDTPGIHKPKHKLGEYMVKAATTALAEVDCVLFLIEPSAYVKESEKEIIARLAKINTPVFLVINKIDTVEKDILLRTIDAYRAVFEFKEIVMISALKGENTAELLGLIAACLPDGPKYFPDDMITDQPEKHIAAEIIREKILMKMQEEIPHGTAVEIMSMKKRDDKEIVDVEATIYCEKDSHKGMIIGKGGAVLKEIGAASRREIENLLGSQINLQLWVKVKKDWRDSDMLIKNFGYDAKKL